MAEKTQPNLPGLYELIVVDKADSARAYAQRLAMDGADEGTFVWVKKQTEGTGRKGKYWISGHNNLHCAVILRPEDSLKICSQLSLVTSISVSQAITMLGEPMEELRLGWPNDIYLNRGKVAGIHLSGELDSQDQVKWMVISINVNAFEHPSSFGFAAASLKEEGFEFYSHIELMEYFSREFLSWLNRWADQGMAPIRKAWLWRGDWKDELHTVDYNGKTYSGEFNGLQQDGALKLQTTQGIKLFQLEDFYRQEFYR